MISNYKLGFTTVELLTVTAICAALVSMLLVGVQSAREAARRVQCQNNLRQLGIASSSFVARTGAFPSSHVEIENVPGRTEKMGGFWQLHPELEVILPKGSSLDWDVMSDTQKPLLPPSVMACPSSGRLLGYRFSTGLFPTVKNSDGHPHAGILGFSRGIRASEVSDGLSNTVLISEHMSADKDIIVFPYGLAFSTNQTVFNDQQCRESALRREGESKCGVYWWEPSYFHVGFNHLRPPNDEYIDCNATFVDGGTELHQSARSFHSGGVFVLLADGSIQWISSSIDLAAWMAMGTRAAKD